jgi:hypothetical protein
MKKTILMLFAALVLVSCGSSSESQQPTTHCYLESGLYLVTGDVRAAREWAVSGKLKWPPAGWPSEVFNHYNADPELELYVRKAPTQKELFEYLNEGHRVVIVYWTSPNMTHARPMIEYETINFEVIMCYVAGFFNT